MGLAALLGEQTASAAAVSHYGGPKLPVKAKNIIFLFMAGGPSQIDMFDPKPDLLKHQGERPDAVNLRTERQTGGLLPSPFEFKKAGKSGDRTQFELLPQHGDSHRRRLRHPLDVHLQPHARSGAQPDSLGKHPGQPSRRSAPGSRTGSGRKTRICLRSSC